MLLTLVALDVQASIYTVSLRNDTDVAHYNFNAYQPISIIFGRYVVGRVCYQK